MMRGFACLAALVATKVAAHPLCYIDTRPTDFDEVLTFCDSSIAQDGACCTDAEEAAVEANYNSVGVLTGDCASLYKEVMCGVCHSYSGHLYEILGAEYGIQDGLSMKNDFCNSLVAACEGQIDLPTFDGVSYCDRHTGGSDNDDLFYSYPYTPPEVFEPGLTEIFPSSVEFPAQTVSLRQTPGGGMHWLVGQAGEVKSVNTNDMASATTVVDIGGAIPSGGDLYVDYEEGLLDMTFDPGFETNGYFYLSYTCLLDDGEMQRNRLSKFVYTAGDPDATRLSEEILLTSAPKLSSIHSAGWLGFKPSAYSSPASENELYWTTGDSSTQTDPDNVSQDTSNLNGAMMRILVPIDGTGYSIPSGNYQGVLPEICAPGFRNPFRCGFDKDTDILYCGDVGHTNIEEIDIVVCGENYGWSRFEGSRCQEAVEDNEFNPPCASGSRDGFTFPWYEYCHPDYYSTDDADYTNGVDICGDRQLTGHAVIGGYVYRGTIFADLLAGAYIFGDFQNGNVYYLKEEADGLALGTIISDGSLKIISFSETNDGEIMLIDQSHNIYEMPCGDLCATTCLDQAEDQPTYESLGCFADVKTDRALSSMAPVCAEGSQAMSPSVCASYCSISGADYFGVEFGFQCFCGESGEDYGRHGELPATSCEYLCTATPGSFCGGVNAIEVFSVEAPVATVAPAPSPFIEPTLDPVDGTPAPVVELTLQPTVDPVDGTPAPAPVVAPTVDPVDGTPAPAPVVAPTVVDPVDPTEPFTSLGCWSDPKASRIVPGGRVGVSTSMTAEACQALCPADMAFYGTQYSTECWCGNDSTDYDKNGAGVCDYPCSGDESEICGGFNAMTVYSDGALIGCFSDPKASRIMPSMMAASTDTMTTEACYAICEDTPMFGTQYGRECWCIEAGSDYDKNGEATCEHKCTGDQAEICGGYDAMSVYSKA